MSIDHDFPFDPTYQYDLDALLKVGAPQGPEDFETFWRAEYTEALDIPLKMSQREVECPQPGYRLFEVEYDSLGSVADYWLAASALLELYPQAKDRLYYLGESFGGGIGALMLPWDARFKKAYLNIPSFGNHPLRITLPCVGSGQSIQEHYHEGHTEILNVLQYFDAATAASHIQIPVFVAAATFDPAVPPPGQFAVYNALPGPKELFIRQAAHFDLAGNEHDDAAIHARLRRWFQNTN